jgi:hypothetical protein
MLPTEAIEGWNRRVVDGLLRRIEWSGDGRQHIHLCCPFCLSSEDKGHNPECALAFQLNKEE